MQEWRVSTFVGVSGARLNRDYMRLEQGFYSAGFANFLGLSLETSQ